MKTINIEGKDFTVEELTALIKNAKKSSLLDEVYAFNGTNAADFNNLYENLPPHVKGFAQECMIANWYNNGEIPEFDGVQKFWELCFDMTSKEISLGHCFDYYSAADVSARLCFLRKEDALDAWKNFPEIYKLRKA